MSNQIKAIVKAHGRDIERRKEIKLRKHLNPDALFATMKTGFDKIEDHRPGTIEHSLGDALMSGSITGNRPNCLAIMLPDRNSACVPQRITGSTPWMASRFS